MPATDHADALGRLWEDIRAAAMREGIDADGPDHPPAPVTEASLIRTHPAGFSVLFVANVVIADRPRPLRCYVKVRRGQRFGAIGAGPHADQAARLARMEYDELVRAHRFFVAIADGLSVVRPLAHLDSLAALIVTEAAGTDLARLCRTDPATAERALAAAGRWLRRYHHEVHLSSERERSVGETVDETRARVERLARRGVPRRTLDLVLEQFARAADTLGVAHVPSSTTHGDFKLRHLYWHEGTLEVIDFGNIGSGDCYRDVAALLVELAVLPLGTLGVGSASVARFSAAFTDAYFGGPPPAVLQLYVAAALLKKWERRLIRWSPLAPGRTAQRLLERVGMKRVVDRAHLDPWFRSRIDATLARSAVAR